MAKTRDLIDDIGLQNATLTLSLAADSMDGLLQSLGNQANLKARIDDVAAAVSDSVRIATNIQLDEAGARIRPF